MSARILILGCGYTGRRVARLARAAGYEVWATGRHPEAFGGLDVRGARLDLDSGEAADQVAALAGPDWTILYSLPLVGGGADWRITSPMMERVLAPARRVVYLSTTGVYGAATQVDEKTEAEPGDARGRLRLEEEDHIAAVCRETLVLRPAAIYGPGRGVHTSLREGRHRMLGDGRNFISRIHVDDLAALTMAALGSAVTGRYPVADEHPCPAREITEWCARRLGLPMPVGAEVARGDTRSGNRQVDGRAIRRVLGVGLRYPSYREGIEAALREESESETEQ